MIKPPMDHRTFFTQGPSSQGSKQLKNHLGVRLESCKEDQELDVSRNWALGVQEGAQDSWLHQGWGNKHQPWGKGIYVVRWVPT